VSENNVNNNSYGRSRDLILDIQRRIRNAIHVDLNSVDFSLPGHVEPGVAYIDGQSANRLIVILRGCGCEWAQKEEGGCVMCGHLSGSSKGQTIPDRQLRNQFESAVNGFDFSDCPMLCLYNGGSFLNEREISPELRRYMLKRVNDIPQVKRLIIESRAEFITHEILDEIEEIMTDTVVEIGVGVETANDQLRDLVLNKGVTTQDLEIAGDMFRRRERIKMLAYILVNPPFLTESEAIDDAVASLEFAHKIGAQIASLEAVSIQQMTLVSFLAEAGYYKPPWIWSMFEIVKRAAHLDLDLRIGGFEFFPIPKEFTSNCEACDEEMVRRINLFNMTNDLKVIDNCCCPKQCDRAWRKDLEKVNPQDIVSRICTIFDKIDIDVVMERLIRNANLQV